MGLYEVLKAAKIGAASDVFTTLRGRQAPFAKGGSTPTEHEYTGAVPYTFTANGDALLDWYIKGNTTQSGTPTPSAPVDVVGVGTLDGTAYKIPITCSGTTSINLSSVQTTRQIWKLVLTGQETRWRITGSGRLALPFDSDKRPIRETVCFCTHYVGTTATAYGNLADGECTISTMNSADNEFGIYDSDYTTVANFKTFLQEQYAAGTPVTVYYVLATAKTAAVNEPLMKIGDYTDSVTATQAGVTISTANGSNTLSVGTTVQPSEVYIKWKG